MATPLYKARGLWSSTTAYSYLDSVQSGNYTYICVADESTNQNPTQFGLVWVQMPVITQEDQYYLRSREDLLQYEDARFSSLINAMADFYTMRNDQSIWGAFLRAISIELARIEYMYSYNIVSKNPTYLTPSDIKRQYADPLFIAGNFQQISQFDSGDFGSSFKSWAASTGFIARAAILDSNGNLQIASTPGETGVSQPSWSLQLNGTTTDGSVTWTNAGAAPAPLAYPVGYRDMLVDLLAAYQEGATPKSIQDVIYAYTGKNIIVEELYKQITANGFYDQSDRNSVKVSVNVGGTDPLSDIQSLTELQQITNSLYGAIDLAKPAHVGLEFTTVFGVDENVDCFISPRYLTQTQFVTIPSGQQAYYSLIGYVLSELSTKGWKPNSVFSIGDVIQDTNGNIQLATTTGVSGASVPSWNTSVQGQTNDSISSPPSEVVVWVNVGTPQISVQDYALLSDDQKAVYQAYYQNLLCVGSGIDDILRIIIQQVEEPPFDPMLYQAPIFDVNNPTTTLASFGRRLLSPLSSNIWTTLTTLTPVWSGSATYSKGALVRGRAFPQTGSWKLYRALKKSTNQDPFTATTYWTPLASPSVYQAYYLSQHGQYVLGILPWSPSSVFYTGQLMADNNGNLQIASTGGTSSPVVTMDTSQQNEVEIANNLLTLKVTDTSAMGLVEDASLVTLLGFIYADFLNGQTLQVIAFTSNTITMEFVHEDYTSASFAESSATIRIGFSQTKDALTYDGTIVWSCLGANGYTEPAKWIQLVDSDNNLTGEVSNWDINHPYGLLAPRTDLCWEISGGDYFQTLES